MVDLKLSKDDIEKIINKCRWNIHDFYTFEEGMIGEKLCIQPICKRCGLRFPLHDNYNPDSVRRHADVCGQGASSSSASRCSYCTSSHHEDTILYHRRIEWKGRCPYRRAKCPRRGCSGMYEIKISYSNTKAEYIGKGYLNCGICEE